MTEAGFSPDEIFAALERHDVDYVAIGGIAANAQDIADLTEEPG